jgi:hypothetical protein
VCSEACSALKAEEGAFEYCWGGDEPDSVRLCELGGRKLLPGWPGKRSVDMETVLGRGWVSRLILGVLKAEFPVPGPMSEALLQRCRVVMYRGDLRRELYTALPLLERWAGAAISMRVSGACALGDASPVGTRPVACGVQHVTDGSKFAYELREDGAVEVEVLTRCRAEAPSVQRFVGAYGVQKYPAVFVLRSYSDSAGGAEWGRGIAPGVENLGARARFGAVSADDLECPAGCVLTAVALSAL